MYAYIVSASENVIIFLLYRIKRLNIFVLRFILRTVSLELCMTIPKNVNSTPKHNEPNSTNALIKFWKLPSLPETGIYLKDKIVTRHANRNGIGSVNRTVSRL